MEAPHERRIKATSLTAFQEFKERCPKAISLVTEDLAERIFMCGFTEGTIFGFDEAIRTLKEDK